MRHLPDHMPFVMYEYNYIIFQFVIKESKKDDEEYAKLTLVDLAGSERATETQSNNKSRLAEGAEINKSLLALKECIRALDARKTCNSEQHVPFRTSKLTLVLRDSFISKSNISKIIMISCISPGYTSANHTINTLRYSDRLKEKTSIMMKKNHNNNAFITNQAQSALNVINKKITASQIQKKQRSSKNIYEPPTKNKSLNHQDKSKSKEKNKLINNFFNDEDEEEDHLQKLNLNPTPIYKPTVFKPNKPKYVISKTKPEKKNDKTKSIKPVDKEDEVDYLKIKKEDEKENTKEEKVDYYDDPEKDEFDFLDDEEVEKMEKEENLVDNVNYIEDSDKNENIPDQDVIPDLLEEEDLLISSHMKVMKEEATILQEEVSLISNIKGLNNEELPMEDYAFQVEAIISKKLKAYQDLEKKINNYKNLVKK